MSLQMSTLIQFDPLLMAIIAAVSNEPTFTRILLNILSYFSSLASEVGLVKVLAI